MSVDISTYERMYVTSIAENILADAKIKMNMTKLKSLHMLGVKDATKYYKNAVSNNGYIKTSYDHRPYITNRMFTKKGELNIITLSDKRILECMVSRYVDGLVACLDFSSFDPSIMRGVLGDIFPDNFHDWSTELLGCDRNVAKLYNLRLLYAKDLNASMMASATEMMSSGITEDKVFEYLSRISSIKKDIKLFSHNHMDTYSRKGYVVNAYGRKIYPKTADNIFSNIIQSNGSEILVDAIINIAKFSKNKNINILFHRFDAIYLDFSRADFLKNINKLINLMGSSGGSKVGNLKVDVTVGKNIGSLKDFKIE